MYWNVWISATVHVGRRIHSTMKADATGSRVQCSRNGWECQAKMSCCVVVDAVENHRISVARNWRVYGSHPNGLEGELIDVRWGIGSFWCAVTSQACLSYGILKICRCDRAPQEDSRCRFSGGCFARSINKWTHQWASEGNMRGDTLRDLNLKQSYLLGSWATFLLWFLPIRRPFLLHRVSTWTHSTWQCSWLVQCPDVSVISSQSDCCSSVCMCDLTINHSKMVGEHDDVAFSCGIDELGKFLRYNLELIWMN